MKRTSTRLAGIGFALCFALCALAAGCDPEGGPVLCKSHDDCGAQQVCRDNECVDAYDSRNLCFTYQDCPPDMECVKGACAPKQTDGDEDIDRRDDSEDDGTAEESAPEEETEPEWETAINCDDANDCTLDSYNGLTCVHDPGNEGLPCNDANGNTQNDRCQSGVCKGDRVDSDTCCGEECRDCTTIALPHGKFVCTNLQCVGDCDQGFRLTAGVCVSFECEDNNPCTYNGFNTTGDECAFPAMPDQTECTIMVGVCAYEGQCASGECASQVLAACDDAVDCTTDSCDPMRGCRHVPDDAACGENMVCDPTDGCVAATR